MSLRSCSTRLLVLAALVMAAACRSQAAAVNPNDPEIVAAVETILDKAVAAAAAVDPAGALSATTRDDTFTFITEDTMLLGDHEALAAFHTTYALLQKQTNQIIEKRTACCPRTSSWYRRCGRARTPTKPVSLPRPWGSQRRPYSSAATSNGGSFTIINPSPNSCEASRGRFT